jgi:uncharacterized protein (UPF0332 family)
VASLRPPPPGAPMDDFLNRARELVDDADEAYKDNRLDDAQVAAMVAIAHALFSLAWTADLKVDRGPDV